MSEKWYLLLAEQSGYPQPAHGFGYLRATYAAHLGCPTCGIGLVQDDDFRFRAELKAKQSHFVGLNWVPDQVFVKKPVRLEFEKNKITGIRFSRPVLHSTGGRLKTVLQLHVETVLPQGLLGSNLTREVCQEPTDRTEIKILEAVGSRLLKGPFCGKAKFHLPQEGGLAFQKSAFRHQPDIVRTNEWFGFGCSAYRPVLITERVKEIIVQQKWQGAFLQPVELAE